MSKLRSIPYAVLTASLFAAGGASAQSMYGIDQRQDYQQDRIERGIRDGQITRSEAYRLEQGERSIDRAQANARAGWNGGTRAQPQPQAPTIRQAAFNPATPAQTATATPPRTMSYGGQSGSGGRR